MDHVTAFILRLAVTAMIAAALSFAMRAAQASPAEMPPGCLPAVSHASEATNAHAGMHHAPAEVAQVNERVQDAALESSCCASPCMSALIPLAIAARLIHVHATLSPPTFTLPAGTDPDRLIRPPAPPSA